MTYMEKYLEAQRKAEELDRKRAERWRRSAEADHAAFEVRNTGSGIDVGPDPSRAAEIAMWLAFAGVLVWWLL